MLRLRELKSSLPSGQRLVCIGLIEHFGDIVACEPVARHVRDERPADHLVWITRSGYRDLLAHHPALNGVITVDSFSEYSALVGANLAAPMIDLHVNRRRCIETGHVHVKIHGDPAVDVTNYYEYGSLLAAFCRSAGLPPLDSGPRMFLPSKIGDTLPHLPQPFIVLHAKSNETDRDWREDKWFLLAQWFLKHTNFALVEVGLQPLLADRLSNIVNLCGRLSLLQLGEVIRRSSGFVGVDSGPAHMANAFERPSIILLGRYRAFDSYMPYTGYFKTHEHECILRARGPTAGISIEDVTARARHWWARPGRAEPRR